MDTLSHTLWGGGLFGRRGTFMLAMFFGALPDLVSFGLWLPAQVVANGFEFGKPDLAVIPDWVSINYNISHSLIVAFAIIGLVALWRKEIAFVMLAWPFHILLDIPFHTAEFFPTQLFWPVSDVIYDGVAWSNPWVWYSNIAGLMVLYAWRWKRGDFKGIPRT
ncbi:hypothetical protein [Thiomicrorhabdus sp.]|uniref:hypothetical protein n=1 Tax=Thiomicrorhabdus sp. TaxID=2039724 RepID=UPI003568D1DC